VPTAKYFKKAFTAEQEMADGGAAAGTVLYDKIRFRLGNRCA